jgi:hypothetical protein
MKRKIKLTLSIDENLLEEYKKYCNREGFIISRRIEKLMEEELKKKR